MSNDPAASTRREALADAALTTLAREGSRALTHRAVDRAAGVAEGTTSYYFRTRRALLEAAVRRLAQIDTELISALPAVTPDELIEAFTDVVEGVTQGSPGREVARLELALEAAREPDLHQVLTELGALLHRTLADKLAAAELTDPASRATALLVVVDGLVVDRLSGSGARVRSADDVRALLRTALA